MKASHSTQPQSPKDFEKASTPSMQAETSALIRFGKSSRVKLRNSELIALLTCIFATAAAFSNLALSRFAFRGALQKNESVFLQAKITDEWAFYQSRNFRIELAEFAIAAGRKDSLDESLRQKIERLERDKKDITQRARTLEKQREKATALSEKYVYLASIFSQAFAFLQIAVILLPVLVVFRQRFLLSVSLVMGLVGIIYMLVGYIHYLQV